MELDVITYMLINSNLRVTVLASSQLTTNVY